MEKVVLTVTNNLETDQRVNKVALTLQKLGKDVLVVGSRSRKCNESYNPGYATKRLNVIFKKGLFFYMEFNIRLFLYLLFAKVDVYVANDTDTILPNYLASTIRRKKLVADFHELFPEVPEVCERRFVKKVWTLIEDFTIPRIKNGYTVCQSMADYYKDRYGADLKVVRNIPNYRPFNGKLDKFKDFGDKKVILYQGAVNEGRGIEWIMDAMKYLSDAVFVIIGNGDLFNELYAKSQKEEYKDKVFFLGQKPYQELWEYTVSSDLGVCLLKNKGLSYYFSLPNRIFDFMQAHTPILATGFPEIKRIVEVEKTGKTTMSQNPQELANIISEMLHNPLQEDYFIKATEKFAWELEELVLKDIYSNLK